MRLIFFACSKKACDKMQETKERWLAENPEDEIICVVKCKALGELSEKKSLSECTGEGKLKELCRTRGNHGDFSVCGSGRAGAEKPFRGWLWRGCACGGCV